MQLPSDDPRLIPVALRRELIAAGHSDESLARELRRGHLERPRRGAYVDGPTWRELNEEQRYVLTCRAAYMQARTGVVLSHVSALPFSDGSTWGFDLNTVHLTREDGMSGRREAGIQRHSGRLQPGDVVERHGLRFMSPLRATLECSLVGSVESALCVANQFLHRGCFTLADLWSRYEGSVEYWPDSLGTGLVLRLADPRMESVGESRTLYFLFRSGLPKPAPQFEVRDGAELVARLDFAFPEFGFWIEFDGRSKYERYLRPGESSSAAIIREKRREDRVRELTGWHCLRITWADLADPVALEQRIRRLIASIAKERVRRAAS